MTRETKYLIELATAAAEALKDISNLSDVKAGQLRVALLDAIEAARPAPAKCRPVHDWKMPEIGDDALVCNACGRSMDFMSEMTPNLRASIINGRQRHYGDAAGEEFQAAFDAAEADAKRRYVPKPYPVHEIAEVSAPRPAPEGLFDRKVKSPSELLAESADVTNRPDRAQGGLPKRKK